MSESTVVLGVEDAPLQEEMLHFLDRLPRVRVVGAEAEGPAMCRRIREARPDAAIASPTVLKTAADLDGAALLVVSERETTEALRLALRHGARGFYLWPEERQALARDAERAARPRADDQGTKGRVVAVYGPRGGAGVTFLATNLAAAMSMRDARAVLVDADSLFAEVTVALGVPANDDVRTVRDLLPVVDELTPEHLDRVLYTHPRGFRVLLAPHEPSADEALDPPGLTATIRALRSGFDVVIVHLPRALTPSCRAALEVADEVLLVMTLDVLAFRDARRALSVFSELGVDRRCKLVVNRAVSSEVVPADVERVFGMHPVSVLRLDRSVIRAQNRGELVVGRPGQVSRRIRALAELLLEEGER